MVKIFDEMSWVEVQKAVKKTNVIIVPVGVYEAHGPHLPLIVDIIAGKEMAIRGAQALEKEGIDVVVGPTINQGVTNWSIAFPGTINIKPSTLVELVKDVCSSLVKHGFKRIVLASGHMEPTHINALKKAAEEITKETGAKVAVPIYTSSEWINRLPQEKPDFVSHGGGWETSLILNKRPNLLHFDELIKLKPFMVNIEKAVRDKTIKTMRDASPLGYFGDPMIMSKQMGEKALSILSEMISEAVKKILKGDSL